MLEGLVLADFIKFLCQLINFISVTVPLELNGANSGILPDKDSGIEISLVTSNKKDDSIPPSPPEILVHLIENFNGL